MNTTIVMLLFLAGAVVHEAIGAETELEILQSNLTEQAALIQALQGNLTEQAALIQALQGNMTTTGTQLTNLQKKAQKSVICGARTKWVDNNKKINGYTVTAFGTATTSEMDDGIYTVGTTGVYAITVSGNTLVDHENTIRVFLWYNDVIEYDQMIRTYTNGIQIRETQSTTRFKKLYEGDRVGVTFKLEGLPQYLRDISAFNNVEFCVELYQAL